MAKSRAVQADNDSPARMPTQESITALNFGKWCRAQGELDQAKTEAKSVDKHVAGKGLNTKAAAIARKILTQGSSATTAYAALIRDVLQLLEIGGSPIPKEQIEMFPGEEERTPAEDRARKAGRNSAFFDKGTEDNPYDPGSSLGQEWLVGLSEGRAEVDLIMALGSDELIKGAAAHDDPFQDAAE